MQRRKRAVRTIIARWLAVIVVVATMGGEGGTTPTLAAPQDPFTIRPVMQAALTADQNDPTMAGGIIAWADRRTGISDIVTYDTDEGVEQRLALAVPLPVIGAERTQPALDGQTLVWITTPPLDEKLGVAAPATAYGAQTVGAYDLARRKVIPTANITLARKRQPAVSGGTVVYSDKRGGQWDIYGYDIAKEAEFPIAVGNGNHGYAAISGFTVVYDVYRNGSWDVMGYDLRSKREFPIAASPGDQTNPQISGTTVIYVEHGANGGNPSLRLYDFETRREKTLSRDNYVAKPRISGDMIVWEDRRTGFPNVFAYNLREDREYTITRSGTAQSPFVAGKVIGWLNTGAFTARVTASRMVDRLPSDRREPPTVQEPEVQYFAETGHFLKLGFKDKWQQLGAFAYLGYPLTEEFDENGGEFTVQYFERGKLEYVRATRQIRIGLVGVEVTRGRDFLPVPAFPDAPDRRFFPETGHSLATGFKKYWDDNNGAERLGFSISEELLENGVVVQYFERGRLEIRPELEENRRIALGRLGEELLEARGWTKPPPPDTTRFPERA